MRFYGFSPRRVLVRKHLGERPEDVVLEIGPGSGNTARAVLGRTAGYWGVDISEAAVRNLREAFDGRRDVVFEAADVCGGGFLGRTFDRVFSVDTLEHVADGAAFFGFAGRHLAEGGTAVVCFPNGMPEPKGDAGVRHGATWFETREELESAARAAGFEIEEMLEIRDTAWQRGVRVVLWEGPRLVALGLLRVLRAIRENKPDVPVGRSSRVSRPGEATCEADKCDSGSRRPSDRDTYEGTESFRINARGGVVRDAAALWAGMAQGAARLFPPYRAFPAGADIMERRILLRLRKTRPEASKETGV
ncbi:MAG: class I SAM-dependent methyltransferase [Acidobacteriota bacterium]|nr:class I SAM-dependent methyltransferase [Acidobacteriota bacterium]